MPKALRLVGRLFVNVRWAILISTFSLLPCLLVSSRGQCGVWMRPYSLSIFSQVSAKSNKLPLLNQPSAVDVFISQTASISKWVLQLDCIRYQSNNEEPPYSPSLGLPCFPSFLIQKPGPAGASLGKEGFPCPVSLCPVPCTCDTTES